MKKILVAMLLLLSMIVFAEKLTTDGKYNMDKLQGSWGNSPDDIITIRRNNNKWIIGTYVGDCEGVSNCKNGTAWNIIQKYKNNVFIVRNFYEIPSKKDKNLYFAYDTKYKKLVELDSQLNIIDKINKK
jgi:hypothetical protein